jgi:hypothetical protein
MPASQTPLPEPVVDIEWIAAEFLIEEGDVALADDRAALDKLTDSALADRMITAWADRLGKFDFEQVVDAFRRLRSE